MKKQTPFLDFYHHWMKPENQDKDCYLCWFMDRNNTIPLTEKQYQHRHPVFFDAFDIMRPTQEEIRETFGEMIESWLNCSPDGKYGFNEMRQTFVLFCAALNNEL